MIKRQLVTIPAPGKICTSIPVVFLAGHVAANVQEQSHATSATSHLCNGHHWVKRLGRIMLDCCLGHLRDEAHLGTSGLMWSLPVLPNWYVCSAIDVNELQNIGNLPS